jgi:uncharacterized protein YxjI
MRRYRMRQKLFSLRDAFRIESADGESRYIVKGRLISLRDRLSFQDEEGEELQHIIQRLVSFRPRYEIYRGGHRYATVKKRLLVPIGSRFVISVAGGPKLTARGNFLDYEYSFRQAGRHVAQVSKRWFTLADTYGVQVDDDVDDLLILACAVVIDMLNHNPERERDHKRAPKPELDE